MNTETDSLVSNSKNRDGLARIFEHVADRLDEMRAEMFPNREGKKTTSEEGRGDV